MSHYAVPRRMIGMKTPESRQVPEISPVRHLGFWSNLGGGSLTFAILIHLIVLLVGAIWVFQIIRPPAAKPDIAFIHGKPGGHEGPTTRQLSKAPQARPQVVPVSELTRVVATGATGLVIPNIDQSFGKMDSLPSTMSGGPAGGGGGSRMGNGPGQGPGTALFKGNGTKISFEFLPPSVSRRCSKADRLARLRETGGTPACEAAVVKGLLWLKANQNSDGSWGAANQAAMTGLSLLAYFGHCETPASEEFGESCVKGIAWLVDLGLKNNGRLATHPGANSWPYEHAIATYALAEALTFCKEINNGYKIPSLAEVTGKAGQFIIDNQHKNGGWAYQYAIYDGHTDVSVTGWQMQALKACSHTGLKFRSLTGCISKALKYLQSCQNESGGFGYAGRADGQRDGYFTLTGVGMLCHQMWDKGGVSEVRKAAKYVLQNTKFDYNGECCDLYGHYYESQAMIQRGGQDWKKYNGLFRDQLLNNQDGDGSWKVPGGGMPIRAAAAEFVANKVYRACLCTLMLEVYYRFLTTGGTNVRDPSGI